MNIIFTFIGWFGWNLFEFTTEKDVADNMDRPFSIRQYASKKWDNWLWTFVVATSLLFIGHAGLGMDLVKTFDEDMEWSDLYYLGSGILSEAVSFWVRKLRKKTLIDK